MMMVLTMSKGIFNVYQWDTEATRDDLVADDKPDPIMMQSME